jgi:hypothetical protein
MNFQEVAAPFLAAFVIAVVIWATIGPSSKEPTRMINKHHNAGPP